MQTGRRIPFSIIIADTMAEVEKIHRIRNLPPLLSWAEQEKKILEELEKNEILDPGGYGLPLNEVRNLAMGRAKSAYISSAVNVTLYALTPNPKVMLNTIFRQLGFPDKATFLARECWIPIRNGVSDFRARDERCNVIYDNLDKIPVVR